MAKKYSDIKELEKELAEYINIDKSNWTNIYRLMELVKTEKLYLQRKDTKTFTAWVNVVAERMQVHVSLLWKDLKAGSIYAEYAQRAEEQGRQIKSLEEITVTPDSLSLCVQAAGKNKSEIDNLVNKVVNGELRRKDLRAAAKAKREMSNADEKENSIDKVVRERNLTKTHKQVTAPYIVRSFNGNTSWLNGDHNNPYRQQFYRCFEEFRVHSGTSHHARRVDIMIVENYTANASDEVILRGIEIKVDKSDLLADKKMAEYADYCDYFYIAIPANDSALLWTAKSIRRPEWGILTVSKDGIIKVEEEAEKLPALFRDKSLATCIIKMS